MTCVQAMDVDEDETEIPDSQLEPRLRDFVQLICDVNMMKSRMVEIGYDAERLPLGKLSKNHIQVASKADVVTASQGTFLSEGMAFCNGSQTELKTRMTSPSNNSAASSTRWYLFVATLSPVDGSSDRFLMTTA